MSKYIDLDSTYRNRNQYSNPSDFVIPVYLTPGDFDYILLSAPFTGSTKPIYDNTTQFSVDETHITLDEAEPDIENFYKNNNLQIDNEFHEILSYNKTTKVAVVETGFASVPPIGTHYTIRKVGSYFNTNVLPFDPDPLTGVVTHLNILNRTPSLISNFYTKSFFTFDNGPLFGQIGLISHYSPESVNLAWVQPTINGSVALVSTLTVFGYQFSVNNIGLFYSVTLNLSSLETVAAYRTLQIRLRNGTNTGAILYTTTVQVSDVSLPTDTTFIFNTNVLISNNPGQFYTLTIQDITPNGLTTGFVYLYGVPNSNQLVTYNTNTFPRMSVSLIPIPGDLVWSQPTVDGLTTSLSTTQEFGYKFTVTPDDSYLFGSLVVGSYAATNSSNEYQGFSVRTNGDYIVWGSPNDNAGIGCIWIYTISLQTSIKIFPTDNIGNSLFGNSLGINSDGTRIIVGGPGDNSDRGAVWIYTLSGSNWNSVKIVPIGTPGIFDIQFGYSVDMSDDGNRIVVGCPNGTPFNFSIHDGFIVIYNWNGSSWAQLQNPTPTGSNGSRSGTSVAISNDQTYIASGGPNDNSDIGSVWIYQFNGSTYVGTQIVPTDNSGNSQFGFSVDLNPDGTTMCIGGPYDTTNNGAVWIYTYNGSWTEQQKIMAVDALNVNQGWCVVYSDEKVFFGDPFYNANVGIVHSWSRSSTIWSENVNIVGTVNVPPAKFGYNIAIANDTNHFVIGNIEDTADTLTLYPSVENKYISYVRNDGSVYLSSNNGVTFSALTPTAIISVSISNTGQYITCISSSTVYYSSDFGASFNSVLLDLGNGLVSVSQNGMYQTVASLTNVYYSSDFGGSWNSSVLQLIDVCVIGLYQLACSPTDVYASIDGGVNWTSLVTYSNTLIQTGYFQTPPVNNNGGNGYVGQGKGVAMSADGSTLAIVYTFYSQFLNDMNGGAFIYNNVGGVWTYEANVVTNNGASFVTAISCCLSSDGNILVIGEDSNHVGAAYVFTRSGGIWTQTQKLVGTGNSGNSRQGYFVSMSKDDLTLAVGGIGDTADKGAVWIYNNSGGTWTQFGNKLVSFVPNSGFQGIGISLNDDGTALAIGGNAADGNVGAVWVWNYSEDNGGQYIIIATNSSTTYLSSDSGASFTQIAIGLTVVECCISGNGQYILLSNGSSTVYVSNNFGGSFSTVSVSSGGQIRGVAIDSTGQYQLVGGIGNILQSNDYGVTFNLVSLSISGKDVYYSPAGQYASAVKSAFLSSISSNFGSSWSNTSDSDTTQFGSAISNDGQYLTVINTSGGIRVSNNGGSSFSFVNITVGSRGNVCMSSSGQYQIIGVNQGTSIYAYTSSDYGVNWTSHSVAGTNSGSVSIGATGKNQYASVNGAFYVSTDFGVTFTLNTNLTQTANTTRNRTLSVNAGTGIASWSETQKLLGSINGVPITNGAFGTSVSINGNGTVLVCGAPQLNTGVNNVGGFWVFKLSSGVWTQVGNLLRPNDYTGSPRLGYSCVISQDGTEFIVGCLFDNVERGGVWFYKETNGVWYQVGSKTLGTGYPYTRAWQGASVSADLTFSNIVIGAPSDESGDVGWGWGAGWAFTTPTLVTSCGSLIDEETISYSLRGNNTQTSRIYTSLNSGSSFSYWDSGLVQEIKSLSLGGTIILSSVVANSTYIGYMSTDNGTTFTGVSGVSNSIGGTVVSGSSKYLYISNGTLFGSSNSGTSFTSNGATSNVYNGNRNMSISTAAKTGSIIQGTVDIFVKNPSTNTEVTGVMLTLSAYSTRSVLLRIRDGAGLSGNIIFSTTITINATANPTATLLSFSNVPVTISADYTLSLQDVTNSSGFIYLFGITSDLTYVAYNTSAYPQLTIKGKTSSQSNLTFFEQPSNPTQSVNVTSSEVGFRFVPSNSGYLSFFTINLLSNGNRSMTFNLYNGAGLGGGLLYTTTINVIGSDNGSVSSTYNTILNNAVSIINGNEYTIGLLDNGAGAGVRVFGTVTDGTYIAYNTSIYPQLACYIPTTPVSVFSQTTNDITTEILTGENGYLFYPIVNGYLFDFALFMSVFSSTGIRTFDCKLILGAGLGGSVIATSTINVANNASLTYINLTFDPETTPVLVMNDPYTLSIEDVTVGGEGYTQIFGIASSGLFTVYNGSVYPGMKLFIPQYIITFSPGVSIDSFIGDGTDQISLSVSSAQNTSALLYGSGIRKMTKNVVASFN